MRRPDPAPGSRTRSPPIARHSSRETYRPRPLPSSGARVSPPRTNRPNSRAAVGVRRRPGRRRAIVSADRLVGGSSATMSTLTGVRPPYFTALSSSAQRTWSSWSASAMASQPSDGRRARTGRRPRRPAPPTPAGRAAASETTSPAGAARRTRAASRSAAGGPSGDSRSDCSAMIPRRRSGRSSSELVGVGADAGQRRLEVVADAAEEVVLGRIELEQLGVLGLDLGEQLGVPDGDRDLAREQLEEVLVGALPAPRRRQVTDEDTRVPPRRRAGRPGPAAARPGRAPPTGSGAGRRGGSGSRSSRSGLGVGGRPPGEELRRRRAARRSRSRRGSGPARGCGARGRRRAGCGSRRAGPARRRPGPDRRRQVARRRRGRRPRRSPAAGPSGRPRAGRRAGSRAGRR